jgi:hypothetical protein
MPTKKPLRDMMGPIHQHIRNHLEYLTYNNRLFLVFEGQLRKEIEDSLRLELSDNAYKKAIQRVPSINLLTRIIDKLSRVYSQPVERTTASATDQALIKQYETDAAVTDKMASANKLYNLHKCAAVEAFVQDEEMHLRVVPANSFLFFSDDLVNPLRPTVYIKFMDTVRNRPFTDRDGRRVEIDDIRLVQAYYLWSDDEFMITDSEGQIRSDLMKERELQGVNPLGRLPAAYINRSDFRLIPLPDTDTLENTVLIPKLLADLNYAVQFQSHTILVATDLNLPADMTLNPDTVWDLSSKDEVKHGRFEAIKPSVDIDQVIGLVKATLAIWLESRNIQAGDMGQMSPGDAASGLARIIDESDATQDRQAQCVRFQSVERDVWSLIAAMHNYLAASGQIKDTRQFSDDLRVSVRFGDQKPVVTDQEKVTVITLKLASGLITTERAIRELYPNWSDEEVAAELKALTDERATRQAAAADTQASNGPGNTTGGGGSTPPNGTGTGSGAGAGGTQSGQPDKSAGTTKP